METEKTAITLPDLPYLIDGLEPVFSAETLKLHYAKHHNVYVENTNRLIAGTDQEREELRNKQECRRPGSGGAF